MSLSPAFVHLHVHSEFSLLDSVLRVKPLVEAVRAAQMPALALTERSNMFSLVKFFRASLAAGVKPVIGAEIVLAEEEGVASASLVLLCRNVVGYRALGRLLSRAYREGQARGEPLLRRGWVEAESEHLIALSAGLAGDVGQALAAGNARRARVLASYWREHFPDRYYLELTRGSDTPWMIYHIPGRTAVHRAVRPLRRHAGARQRRLRVYRRGCGRHRR